MIVRTRKTRRRNPPTIAGPVKITTADGSVTFKQPYGGVTSKKKPPKFSGAAALRLPRSEYQDYIQSDAWLKRRLEFLKTHDKCRKCGTDQDLHVHHKTYKNLGREHDRDLTTLCERCHNKLHKYMDTNFLTVETASKRFLNSSVN